MTTKEKGDYAAAAAILYYVGKQYEVLTPFGDRKKYDFVVDKNGKLLRVQVKYVGMGKNGEFRAPLRVMGGNQSYSTAKSYDRSDFELFFAVTSTGNMYEIPSEIATKNVSTLSLEPKYNKYKVN